VRLQRNPQLEEGGTVVGFVTLCGTAVYREGLPDDIAARMPRYPLPALLIAWLGVDVKYQGHDRSRELMRFALAEAASTYSRTGCVGVFVDAKPDARDLYKPYGFIEVEMTGTGCVPKVL
jgi:GNAT superfamily N-acetyltransferase